MCHLAITEGQICGRVDSSAEAPEFPAVGHREVTGQIPSPGPDPGSSGYGWGNLSCPNDHTLVVGQGCHHLRLVRRSYTAPSQTGEGQSDQGGCP